MDPPLEPFKTPKKPSTKPIGKPIRKPFSKPITKPIGEPFGKPTSKPFGKLIGKLIWLTVWVPENKLKKSCLVNKKGVSLGIEKARSLSRGLDLKIRKSRPDSAPHSLLKVKL